MSLMRCLPGILVFATQFAQAGGLVGNGGDVIECRSDPAIPLSGMYSLDFVLTLQKDGGDIVPTNNWQASMYRIRRGLEMKAPELLPSFDEFNHFLRNPDKSQRRYWEPTDLKLVDVKDEEIEGKLVEIPDNCKRGSAVSLTQAVIRQPPSRSGSSQVVYVYMPALFDRLAAETPLQLSFLLVHEWLWDLSQDVTRNRRLNHFLHSEDLDRLSAPQVRDTLRGMGLDVDTVPRIVDRTGAGHFRTLGEALTSYRDGETLVLKQGVYREGAVRISRPVRIVGEGNPEDIVIETDGGFIISDEGVQVENLTLHRKAIEEPGHGLQPVVEVTHGTASFKNVTVAGDDYGLIIGIGASADFSDGELRCPHAVRMSREASGRFHRNTIRGSFDLDDWRSHDVDSVSTNQVEIVGNTFYAPGIRGTPKPGSVVRDNKPGPR